MLEIKNVTKKYGSKAVVDNLSLSIAAGDIYGFIGHNGAGKTTTIKCVTGIIPFDQGEIYIDDKSIVKDPLSCKQITAYIPDNPDLYEHLTGIQYLNFIADIFKINSDTRYKRINKYANLFEIEQNLGDLLSTFSHGMKQKVAIISALVHQPKLLILDEPFVGLDPKSALALKNTMKELCQEGTAIFFSTHVLDVAEKLCTKVAIIKEGKLIAKGSMEDIKGDSSLENVFMELTDHE